MSGWNPMGSNPLQSYADQAHTKQKLKQKRHQQEMRDKMREAGIDMDQHRWFVTRVILRLLGKR